MSRGGRLKPRRAFVATRESTKLSAMPPGDRVDTARRRPLSGIVRLLLAAAVLHVSASLFMVAVGGSGAAAELVDEGGVLAGDARHFRDHAVSLAATLRDEGAGAWMMRRGALHSRIFSVGYAVLGPA